MRSVVLAVLGVGLALALAIGVGMVVYKQSMLEALKPELSADISTALVAEEEDKVVWNLLTVSNYTGDESSEAGLDRCALVGIDPANLKISILWIPAELRVYVAGYGYRSLSEAYEMEDDATFLRACCDVAGVGVSHYLEMSKGGLEAYLTELGLETSLSKEKVASNLVEKILGSSSEQLGDQIELLEKYLATDIDTKGLLAAVSSMRGMDVTGDVFNEDMPLEDERTAEGYVQSKAAEWATMTKRVSEGLDPVAGKAELTKSAAIRSNAKVTIWNGVGVSGIASDCAEHLKKQGWGLESTGNAASFVYEETLVVYNYDEDRDMAELLVSDLGQGRAVRSAARYSFEGDILVVVGKDYQPY